MKHQYILNIFLLLVCSQYAIAQQTDKKFGRNEIIEDLAYLNHSLKDAHYNLFAYTSEKTLQRIIKM